MDRKKAHFQEKEPLVENILRILRYNKVKPYIKKNAALLDLGCGYNATFLTEMADKIGKGVGIDTCTNTKLKNKKLVLINSDLNTKLPLKSRSFDQVVLLAVLEHFEKPKKILTECRRIMKKNGDLLITTPDKKSEKLLKFLAKVSVISKKEIKDHKKYFDEKALRDYLERTGFKTIKVDTFELGFNIFVHAKKSSQRK